MLRFYSVLLLIFITPCLVHGNEFIIINEISASNSTYEDQSGEADDWIELYNSGIESVNLNGYFISDDTENLQKWQLNESFLDELVLEPGDYFLFWADNDITQGTFHIGFTLKKSGETIILSNSDLTTSCELTYPSLLTNITYGYSEALDTWNYYTNTTPGAANSTSYFDGITPTAEYSVIGGLYQDDQSVSLSSTLASSTIRYTIDNSEPNESSPIYSVPIDIGTTTNLRTKVFHPNYIPNISKCESYIFDSDFTLNIVSVSADDEALFGEEGIYENPYNNVEIPISFSYFEPDGTPLFSQNLGLKIHAPDNASQKSLRFYARSEYGENAIDFPLFEQREYTNYKRIVLRNGGNDQLNLGKTLMRDVLGTTLYGELDEDNGWSAFTRVHAFLNGEYWGIYNMRERQDNHWLEQNYGYEAEEVDFLERMAEGNTFGVFSGDWDNYDAMEQTAIDLDLSDDDNYAIIENWMNIENFIDYEFAEIFFGNKDWLSNNLKLWKPIDNSRKWEWILWDIDYGIGHLYPNYAEGFSDYNYLSFATSNWGGWTSNVETYLLQNLVENQNFAEKFSSRGADILNSTYKEAYIEARIDSYRNILSADIDKHFDRWNGNNMTLWEGKVDYVEEFLLGRPVHVRQHFTDRFELGEIYTIDLNTIPASSGYLEINTIESEIFPWQGHYFENIPVRLKAIPLPGYVFIEWEETGQTDQEIFVDMTSNLTYTAVFEGTEIPQLVINEIYYQNDPLQSTDWIEIYNAGGESVELDGFTINDLNENTFTIPSATTIAVGEYLILANDVASITNQYPLLTTQGTNILDMQNALGLNNVEDAVVFKNNEGVEIDFVHYLNGETPWPGIEVDEYQSIQLNSAGNDNNDGSNWFSNAQPFETPGIQNEVITDDSVENKSNRELFVGTYPNPTHDKINIIIDHGIAQKFSIKVFNSLGLEVLDFGEYEGSSRYEIQKDIPLASGLYFLRIQGENLSITKTINKN